MADRYPRRAPRHLFRVEGKTFVAEFQTEQRAPRLWVVTAAAPLVYVQVIGRNEDDAIAWFVSRGCRVEQVNDA